MGTYRTILTPFNQHIGLLDTFDHFSRPIGQVQHRRKSRLCISMKTKATFLYACVAIGMLGHGLDIELVWADAEYDSDKSYMPRSLNVIRCNCIKSGVNSLARGKYFTSVGAWIGVLASLEIYAMFKRHNFGGGISQRTINWTEFDFLNLRSYL